LQQDFERVKINFEYVCRILINNAASGGQREFRPGTPITALADTEARVHTEKSASRSLHHWLWILYGNNVLQSNFGVSNFEATKEELAYVTKQFQTFCNSWKKDITAYLFAKDVDVIVEDNISGAISQVELNETFDLYHLSDCKQVVEHLDKVFKRFYPVAFEHLQKYFTSKKDNNLMTKVANTTSQRKFIARAHSLINWLHFQFESLIPDRLCTVH
jgi:hypothetical protein